MVQCLRALLGEGRTIVCTIHSPTSKAFALFDELLVLQAGRPSPIITSPTTQLSTSRRDARSLLLPRGSVPASLLVLQAGQLAYGGAVKRVEPYFEALGFSRGPDASLPEWLVDVMEARPRPLASDLSHQYPIDKPACSHCWPGLRALRSVCDPVGIP